MSVQACNGIETYLAFISVKWRSVWRFRGQVRLLVSFRGQVRTTGIILVAFEMNIEEQVRKQEIS